MNISLPDSIGNVLILTTDVDGYSFDTVTCSPHPRGFTVLNGLIDRPANRSIVEACVQTHASNEVCILPAAVSSRWRVLLTPTLNNLEPDSRHAAAKLMEDLFAASQTSEVCATGLLITHFAHINRYPELHVLGILDAIKALASGSYGRLKVLCMEFPPKYLPRFEGNVKDVFTV